MGVVMTQVVPPVPDELDYPLVRLWLLPRIANRDEYQRIFGEQAPAFDPTKPPKHWVDTEASDITYKFLSYRTTSAGEDLLPVEVTGEQARTVNIPGTYTYPPYTPDASTSAVLFSPFGYQQVLPWASLSTREEADAVARNIAKDLSITATVREQAVPGQTISWGTETRRQYELVSDKFAPANVAALLRDQYQRGVGYPGAWVLDDYDGKVKVLNWMPVPVPVSTNINNLDEVPMPCRPLVEGERIVRRGIGGSQIIVIRPGSTVDSGGGGAGLTAEQAAMLAQAAKIGPLVPALLELLGRWGIKP